MPFTCDRCGEVDHILIDGYHVGDRLLESVLFEVRHENGVYSAKTRPQDANYMKGLNEPKWNAEMADPSLPGNSQEAGWLSGPRR